MSNSASVSKAKKRRLRLAALGLVVLGLWGMLALLLGASLGKETRYRADLKTDLQPGFGETHATPHPLEERGEAATHERPIYKDLPPFCLDADCVGTAQGRDTAYLDRPPGNDVDDATSSIGGPRGPQGSSGPFNIAQGGSPNFFPNGLFIPGGGGNPNPGAPENPNGDNPNSPDDLNPPDNSNPPQKPGDTPPPDFLQPPLNPPVFDRPAPDGPGPTEPPGPNVPGPDDPGPHGPLGPDGPPNGGGPDKPIQIPEPLTLSLFAAGLAGFVLLRRRKSHSSK